MIELKNKAIFIADAHENDERQGFWEFLQAFDKGSIQSPQLFLMGDIFDLLIYQIKPTHQFAKAYIELLEKIAAKGVEIIYLEGNHDFNLSPFFKKVKVFPLNKQPLKLRIKQTKNESHLKNPRAEFTDIKNIYLAHGDIFLSPLLSFILKNLRNKILLYILNCINTLSFGFIYQKILAKQKKKKLFFQLAHFEKLATQRALKYPQNKALIIEGHYHQNCILNKNTIKYINLASFAHKRSFFVVECGKKIKFQEKNLRG